MFWNFKTLWRLYTVKLEDKLIGICATWQNETQERTNTKDVLDLKLLSIRHHPLLMNIFSIGLLHPLPSPHHCLTHSQYCILYIHHQSSVPGNPKMMSELVSLFHSDLHPVILLLVSYFFPFCSFCLSVSVDYILVDYIYITFISLKYFFLPLHDNILKYLYSKFLYF